MTSRPFLPSRRRLPSPHRSDPQVAAPVGRKLKCIVARSEAGAWRRQFRRVFGSNGSCDYPTRKFRRRTGSQLSDIAYQRQWLPNRSLTPAGRVIWLLLIGGMAVLIATAFAIAGVWWVLPFAGAEVALLVWAFRRIAAGDADFEKLEVRSGAWSYRAHRDGEDVAACGATCWLAVDEQEIHGRLVVRLRYAGRQYLVGSFLPEDQRAGLARELAGVIRETR